MASAATVFIPPNGANINQTAPGLPSVPLQASGATSYPPYGVQQLGIPTNAPQQVPQKSPFERFLKAESKMVGFISSGSLCVAAANSSNHGLVKSSVGMNITCAIMTLAGIMLYISDLIISSTPIFESVGVGLSSVLFLFTMLEFCIAVSLAHFGCQAACYTDSQPTMAVPYQVTGDGEAAAAPTPPPPPTYDNMITKAQ